MIKYIDGDNYNRIFICTDIHGCYTAFMQKLQELGFDPKKDLVVCSGDLVDRGKENVKCVELIDKPWFESIKGNHCVDSYTEILTKNGWKFSNLISLEDDVATVDLSSGISYFAKPLRIVKNSNSQLYQVTAPRIDAVVSNGHNIVIDGKLKNISECEGRYPYSRFTFTSKSAQSGINENLDFLKLIVYVVCDSTLVRSSINKCRVQFKLSKERKISALRKLLNTLNIPYTFKECKKTGLNKLQPYYIRIYGQHARDIFKYLQDVKQFPSYWTQANKQELEAILEALVATDAHITKNNFISWKTINKHDIDVLQHACVLNEYKCFYSERKNASGFANGKLQYHCIIHSSELTRPVNYVEISKLDSFGDTYGVTVPHGTIITRRNGKTWVTGNCQFCIEGVTDSYIRQIHSVPNNGGSWLYELPGTTQQNIAAQLDSLPYLIELSFKGKKYGFVHADPIVSDWNELKELVENNYTIGSRSIRDSILWTRRLATYEEHDEHPHITGIDMIYLGHTVLEKPKQIGNCRFIDTGAVFGYEFTIEILS